jgi:hypothetical protein
VFIGEIPLLFYSYGPVARKIDPGHNTNSDRVEIFIGMDLPTAHQSTQIVEPFEGKDAPAAHHMRFGWVMAGIIPRSPFVGLSNKKSVMLKYTRLPPSLSNVVYQSCFLETFGIVLKHKTSTFQDDEHLHLVSML